MHRKRHCPVCYEPVSVKGLGQFCRVCWLQLPDDLRERVRWARTESAIDLQAAIDAAVDHLR